MLQKNSLKRFCIFLLMCIALAACGDTTNTVAPANTTANGSSATSSSGIKLNTNVSGKVELWHFWGSPVRRTAIRRVVAICQQKLPNIKITETFKPFGDIYTANTAAVAAGSGMPDVIVEDRPKLAQAAINNIETNLKTLATQDGVNGSSFWPFTWEQSLYNGDPYGIPFSTDVQVLYYNKNAFKEVGLDPNKPPQTWQELEDYATKLDKKNADGSWARVGFGPTIGAGWDIWSLTNGAEYVNKDGKPTVNDPKVVDTISWLKKWFDRYGGFTAFDKFKGSFSSPPNDAFMSGKVAMLADINGYSSQLNFYRPQVAKSDGTGKENLDWGIAPLPHSESGPVANSSGGFALSIPRGSKNTPAAWEFIKCATDTEAITSWARDTYEIPANKEASKSAALTADPNWEIMINALNTTKVMPFAKSYANFGEEVNKRLQDIYTGKKDPKNALDEAQAAIDSEVAKNKR